MALSVVSMPILYTFFRYLVLSLTVNMSSQQYISDDQIAQAGITREIATTMEEAWNFEQSTWATGSVASDHVYIVPSTSLSAAPGTLLKAEEASDTAKFTLPPSTALSRILFQTRTLKGKAVPASAFVLWPYNPRRQPDGTIPVVSWAHGTSGLFGDQGPSHLKALSCQFGAPYTLALQGYVVVGADYAGLSVNHTARAETVHHEFLANPAHANDLFYSVQAAQAAFPQLSKQSVIMGHSQGGGAAWAAAQRQAVHPVPGYLGAVAGSPVTDLFKLPPRGPLFSILTTFVLYALQSLYPEFDYRDVLTEQAAKRWELYLQLKAGDGVAFSLLLGIDLLKTRIRAEPLLARLRQQDFQRREGHRRAFARIAGTSGRQYRRGDDNASGSRHLQSLPKKRSAVPDVGRGHAQSDHVCGAANVAAMDRRSFYGSSGCAWVPRKQAEPVLTTNAVQRRCQLDHRGRNGLV
ncbi:MAG: hypothetical protein Q9199_006634 [Rusavskia elegans]